MPKHTVRQHEDIRKKILKKLATGGIKQTELERMFPDASTSIVHEVITGMQQRGEVSIEEKNGWNVVTLPPAVRKPSKKEIKVEPILPSVEPIVPRIEPLKRPSGVFVEDSPERLILSMLADGARMRENLVRLVAGQMDAEDANKLLDRMIRSGIINETKSGRISLIHKYDHVYE